MKHSFFRCSIPVLSSIVLCCCMLNSLSYADPVIVSGGTANDYEGWIARLNDNRLMVIFCRNPDWASGDLYVTFSTDNGMTWDSVTPIIVETGDQATLSFAQLPHDTLRVWYASNESGQYGIYSAKSMDGLSWTREGWLDIGWFPSDMFYDPTVITESDSSRTMSYRGPGGAYITHKPYHGEWDTLCTMVGSGGYRPRVMKHTNGTYLYTYHRNIGSNQYEVFVRTSLDRITWSDEIRLTFAGNSHDPFPNETPDGAYLVYYATYQSPAYNLYYRRSYDAVNWENEVQVTADMTNNTQPHFFIEDSTINLLWAHCVSYPYDHDVYFEPFTYVAIQENNVAYNAINKTLTITPNVCASTCTIRYDHLSGDVRAIELYDIQGRLQKLWNPDRTGTSRVELHDLPQGVYVIRVTSDSDCASGKIIKIR